MHTPTESAHPEDLLSIGIPGAQERAEDAFRVFMACLGLDCDDPHLRETPRRVAHMYLTELFAPRDVAFTTFPAEGDEMIVVRDIPFSSTCAHHFTPFRGVAHVAYIPRAHMVGLSKIARVVDHFAHRPQVQERLTTQIADNLVLHLDPHGVGVMLRAEHLCMAVRGVTKPGVQTVTSVLRGALLKPEARAEFFALMSS